MNEVITNMNDHLETQTKIVKEKFKSLETIMKNLVQKEEYFKLSEEIQKQNFFQNLITTITLETIKISHMFTMCKMHKISELILPKTKLIEDLSKLK